MVVPSPQYGENTAFFSSFPINGIHSQGILLFLPLEFQGKKHQPFSMTQPFVTEEARTEARLPQRGDAAVPRLPFPHPGEGRRQGMDVMPAVPKGGGTGMTCRIAFIRHRRATASGLAAAASGMPCR